jgi:hypothetical protein
MTGSPVKPEGYYKATAGQFFVGELVAETGTFSTSGVLVTGTGTKFIKDFTDKGAFLVDTTNFEVRKIKSIVSDTQMYLETAFSGNRTNLACNRGFSRFVQLNVVSASGTTTVNGIQIIPNTVFYMDTDGGFEPFYIIHSAETTVLGLVKSL